MTDDHAEHWARVRADYLRSEDPRGQSGFQGDEAAWRRARQRILEALDRDGTFLDIGCANGLLMETLTMWARDRGLRIEPFGLEVSPGLAAAARERLPEWSDRIFERDATRWPPPFRFDFVRTELVYAPEGRRPAFLRRLLDQVVDPGGRLVVCSYGNARSQEPAAPLSARLGGWGFPVAGEAEALNDERFPLTRVAWIDGADRRPGPRRIP